MTVACNKKFLKFELEFLKVADADFAYTRRSKWSH
jgi:hypothetical protein